ncbi:MAG TPA: hypothetical protein VMR16_02300 [Candidatus Saccharimonadales bacterium]|nr:hypothetical protein [Candidatus Saccharimonadales bacterium]
MFHPHGLGFRLGRCGHLLDCLGFGLFGSSKRPAKIPQNQAASDDTSIHNSHLPLITNDSGSEASGMI